MHFIGIFANHLEFEIIKHKLEKIIKRKDIKFININIKNIENMRNIVFETIVICNEINIFNKQKNIMNKICNNCKYLVINSDKCTNTNIIFNKLINCITYGLNQKSTITISSFQDEKIILSIQRNIKNIEGKDFEMGEICIDVEENKEINIENILAIFAIYVIYAKKVIEK